MSKREIIERIQKINTSAPSEFLAGFSDSELLAYLHQLQELRTEKLCRPREKELALAEI